MKIVTLKKLFFPAIAMASVLALAGCSGQENTPSTQAETQRKEATAETAAEGADKLRVMASFYPMYDFAVKIGGEYAEVSNMVPAGTEPHDWEPSATDIRELEQADLFIYSGAGMEHWAEDILESLSSQSLISVEASEGIELLAGHEHEEEEEHSEEAGHDHGEYDPHVWLSPINAGKEMENIKNAFVQADPVHAEYFEENYEKYAAMLDELDAEFRKQLSGLPRKEIVVNHEAFGYLCHAYGLEQLGISGLSPEEEPDPKKMAEITDFVKENNVKIIFSEELVSPKVAESVASETGAQVEVLNPLEGLSEEELAAGADYFSVMKENLAKLVKALS
ncbi:MAG: metal ABC transporter substrate-binding protein [Eubacteriales bacterium]|nr:metal ABC transporter substrate-binding protein [Eubacteriales bacterium]